MEHNGIDSSLRAPSDMLLHSCLPLPRAAWCHPRKAPNVAAGHTQAVASTTCQNVMHPLTYVVQCTASTCATLLSRSWCPLVSLLWCCELSGELHGNLRPDSCLTRFGLPGPSGYGVAWAALVTWWVQYCRRVECPRSGRVCKCPRARLKPCPLPCKWLPVLTHQDDWLAAALACPVPQAVWTHCSPAWPSPTCNQHINAPKLEGLPYSTLLDTV